jgi:hypothetical protein
MIRVGEWPARQAQHARWTPSDACDVPSYGNRTGWNPFPSSSPGSLELGGGAVMLAVDGVSGVSDLYVCAPHLCPERKKKEGKKVNSSLETWQLAAMRLTAPRLITAASHQHEDDPGQSRASSLRSEQLLSNR